MAFGIPQGGGDKHQEKVEKRDLENTAAELRKQFYKEINPGIRNEFFSGKARIKFVTKRLLSKLIKNNSKDANDLKDPDSLCDQYNKKFTKEFCDYCLLQIKHDDDGLALFGLTILLEAGESGLDFIKDCKDYAKSLSNIKKAGMIEDASKYAYKFLGTRINS